jgi:hypothetical protein
MEEELENYGKYVNIVSQGISWILQSVEEPILYLSVTYDKIA